MTLSANKGMTLVDLIIGLAVATIVLSFALPSFSTLSMNNQITTNTNDFISSLAVARSEALKRVGRVTVCKSADGASCTGSGGWEQGWIIFPDADNDAARDAGEDVLRYHQALAHQNTLRGSTSVADYISYDSRGVTRDKNGAFQAGVLVLCDERGPGEHARAIAVNVAGRVRVDDGDPASCTPGLGDGSGR
jgi:type IV fimbrial biogenesis protein FimT